jgi:hypothetical protein
MVRLVFRCAEWCTGNDTAAFNTLVLRAAVIMAVVMGWSQGDWVVHGVGVWLGGGCWVMVMAFVLLVLWGGSCAPAVWVTRRRFRERLQSVWSRGQGDGRKPR